ncbi:MAG: ASKHA domain-containing protein, partial [Armatimonadota bacterium]
MSTQNVEVTFVSAGAAARVRAGQTLAEAAQQASVNIPTPCDGKGTCGKCKVTVLEGEVSEPSEPERRLLSQAELDLGVRLACQAKALGDVRLQSINEADVVVRKELSLQTLREFEFDPNVRRIIPDLQQPEIEDQRSDFLRIRQAAGKEYNELTASLTFLKKLPFVVRESDYEIAMTLIGNRATEVESSALAPDPLGVAVDIGTTTCVAYVINLATGELAATGSTLNPQSAHGADIISRIEHIKESDDGLRELQGEIINAINAMVQQAVDDIGATTDEIYEMTVVGNTAMHHIFLGLDPRYIAEAPYIPVMSEPVAVYARHLGLNAHPDAQVFTLPIVAGFVGADTVGVMTAANITERPPTLAVDIGTNGEIVLWSGERLLCASTAAGPAFEGAQISQGMYAAPGAISEVYLVNGDLEIRTIDN